MSKEEAFVNDLIGYIFAYPDDDYMTMECLCRKLHKHGLIERKDGEWTCNFTEQSPMVGEWKKEVNEKLGKCLRVVYVCSACGCAVGCENFVRRSYCPNCGAKMKGSKK